MQDDMTKPTGVVFILLRDDKKVLLQLRDKNDKKFPNTWCFPGGIKDGDESYIDTVLREAQEEYEIVLIPEDCSLVTTYTIDGLVENNHVFVCNIGNQQPVLHEGADMKWVDIKDIQTLKLGFKQEKFVLELVSYLSASNISYKFI